ncbi:hypothetical protein ACHAXT_013140 [Thalassiosira profunda]
MMFDAASPMNAPPQHPAPVGGEVRRHRRPSAALRPRPLRSVRFSDLSRLSLFPSDPDAAARWYTEADKAHFKKEVSADVLRLRRALAAPSPEAAAPEDCYRLVGIDHLLTPERSLKIVQRRRRHVQFVLKAQGRCTADELGLLSGRSSKSARERAEELADGYRRMDF